jgi:UDP-glucose:glycoprotein glucosyltransferase
LSNEDPQHLDLHSGKPAADIDDVKLLASLSNEDLTATLIKHIRYFEPKNSKEKFMKNKLHFVSMWVVTDLNTKRGRELMKSALEFLKASSGVRLTFLPNADKTTSDSAKDINAIVWSILYTLEGKEAIDKALQVLDGKEDIPDNVKGFLRSVELHLKMLRVYCQRVLKLKSSQTAVISNGRIFGPFEDEEKFTVDDFNLLDKINQQQYIGKMKSALKTLSEEELDLELNSDLMLKLLSLLMPRTSSKNRFSIPPELREEHTVVKLPPKFKVQSLPFISL